MFIKQIVIEGVDGDVEVIGSENADGVRAATVATDIEGHGRHQRNRVVCRMLHTDDPDTRWAAAVMAATAICGTDPSGRPNASSSMIEDVLWVLEHVAGC